MVKLYRISTHPNHWIACEKGAGWVMFPAVDNGWEQRRPARGLDPLYLREVPLRLASNTGIPHLPVEPAFAEVA